MILLTLTALLAQPPALDCSNAMAQQEMNRCAAEQARAAEADMNRTAALVMRQMEEQDGRPNGEGARRLRDAQRTWLAFRDAQCALAGLEALGGSLEPLLVAGCMSEMTERRAAELMTMIR